MTFPIKTAQTLVVIVLFLGSFFILTPTLQKSQKTLLSSQALSDEGGIRWNSELVRIMSFGHAPSIVDIALIRMQLEDRLTHVKSGEHAKTYYDLKLATDLDPRFKELYFHGANFLTIVRGDHLGALNLATKGVAFIENELMSYPQSFQTKYWGDPWRIYLTQGYLRLFQFQDLDAAAESYGKMAKYPETPIILQRLGESLKEPKGIYRVGHRALTMMIDSARDDDEKNMLLQKDRSLLINYFVFQANELHAAHKPFPQLDPVGGKLYLTPEGRVETTSTYEKMFGKIVAVPEKGR